MFVVTEGFCCVKRPIYGENVSLKPHERVMMEAKITVWPSISNIMRAYACVCVCGAG